MENSRKDKNNAKNSLKEWVIENGMILTFYQNNTDKVLEYKRIIKNNYIHFYFNVQGIPNLIFNEGSYTLPISKNKTLLLYNPQKNLSFDIKLEPKDAFFFLFVSIQRFHSLLRGNMQWIEFLKQKNAQQKYYQETFTSPSVATILSQIINADFHTTLQDLYVKTKTYELLCLYFNQIEYPNVERCPFLANKENILKIRHVKEIIIQKMAEPPSLQELANEVDLNLKKLKEGFKQIYGNTIFNFLFDYKMEYARNLLESGLYNVNEVSHKIGYSTSSHFIDAFKKKYGTTPKKYSQNKN